jgi:hypothetical protein
LRHRARGSCLTATAWPAHRQLLTAAISNASV